MVATVRDCGGRVVVISQDQEGAGAPPVVEKRRRFMELRERGLGIDAAARQVGVSRTAGRNWANGYHTYRDGQVVGFVPGLDRLEVREVSARFLSEDERVEIADLIGQA